MAAVFNTAGPFIWDDAVSAISATKKYPLGTLRDEDGKTYRYVQFNDGSGAVASFAYAVAYTLTPATSQWIVTCDVSDTDQNQVAGVLLGVVTDLYYCWMQVKGYATVKTNGDDDIAAHVSLFGVGDGTCDSMAADTASTNKVIGYATADDDNAANTVAAILTLN